MCYSHTDENQPALLVARCCIRSGNIPFSKKVFFTVIKMIFYATLAFLLIASACGKSVQFKDCGKICFHDAISRPVHLESIKKAGSLDLPATDTLFFIRMMINFRLERRHLECGGHNPMQF